MLHEKRKFKRLDIFHVIEIKSYSPILGLIKNFSYQGISFQLDSIDFVQKENIEFKLKYPKNNLIVSFFGDIAWEKRDANSFLAGIKLREHDNEIKDKLIEILCAIRDIPVDFLNQGKNSDILTRERKEEKFIPKLKDDFVSEKPKNYKRKLRLKFIIGLYISIIILLAIITLKALIIPASKTYFKTTPNEQLAKLDNILRKPDKEQSIRMSLDKNGLSDKNNKSTMQISSYDNIEKENKLYDKFKSADQYASRLVYTIQIESLLKIEDAEKQFNYLIRTLNKKNRDFLRIEKVGKYYTVRLGRFENYETAKKFLQEMPPRLSNAIIVKAYIKNERIIRL